jgi:hypothetical protein
MAATEGLSGGNEKHTNTILQWGPRSEEEIREAISLKKSDDLIAMAFCLCHRQMVERTKVVCISKGIDKKTLSDLGFIPADSMDDALEKAFSYVGQDSKIGVQTYSGLVVRPNSIR